MPIFVHLCKGTPEGFKTLKDLPGRWTDVKKRVQEAGGKILGAYALMGRYDYLLITDLPDVKAALSGVLKTAMKGTVTFETLGALPLDEFVKLVKEL